MMDAKIEKRACMRIGCTKQATKQPKITLRADPVSGPAIGLMNLYVCDEHAEEKDIEADILQNQQMIADNFVAMGFAPPDPKLTTVEWVPIEDTEFPDGKGENDLVN